MYRKKENKSPLLPDPLQITLEVLRASSQMISHCQENMINTSPLNSKRCTIFFIVTSNLQNRPTPMKHDQDIFTGHKLSVCTFFQLLLIFNCNGHARNAFNNDLGKLSLGQVHDTSSGHQQSLYEVVTFNSLHNRRNKTGHKL